VGLTCLTLEGSATAQAVFAATNCLYVTGGLDSSTWTTGAGPWLGGSIGQTFLAEDTLISRLTVWRPPNNLSVIGVHLIITEVDTTLSPPRPKTHEIVLDGPTVTVYDSDPPGQLIRVSFALDPPLALPRKGLYAFFLQPEDCASGAPWAIVAREDNPYPYGIYWVTPRVFSTCYLRGVYGGGDNDDLLFKIDYCIPSETPTRSRSWGSVKVFYR
jgi:hypothetical protein